MSNYELELLNEAVSELRNRVERIEEILKNLEPLLMTMGQVQDEVKNRLTRLEREKVYR